MAYNQELADRIRSHALTNERVSEIKMFGGIAFMVGGNMAVGVLGEDLIVRLDREETEKALAEPGVREFDFTGRPTKGIVFVSPEQTSKEEDLAGWVEAGAAYAASLPAK
jgi:TfoX/Sxy family transcriptional regulator of competence genes